MPIKLKVTVPITNTELINEYIHHPNAMHQAFLIEAMGRYCKKIVDNEDEVRKGMVNSAIHPDAWINAAKYWRDLLTKNGRINH